MEEFDNMENKYHDEIIRYLNNEMDDAQELIFIDEMNSNEKLNQLVSLYLLIEKQLVRETIDEVKRKERAKDIFELFRKAGTDNYFVYKTLAIAASLLLLVSAFWWISSRKVDNSIVEKNDSTSTQIVKTNPAPDSILIDKPKSNGSLAFNTISKDLEFIIRDVHGAVPNTKTIELKFSNSKETNYSWDVKTLILYSSDSNLLKRHHWVLFKNSSVADVKNDHDYFLIEDGKSVYKLQKNVNSSLLMEISDDAQKQSILEYIQP